MTDLTTDERYQEAHIRLNCLYLALPESVANDAIPYVKKALDSLKAERDEAKALLDGSTTVIIKMAQDLEAEREKVRLLREGAEHVKRALQSDVVDEAVVINALSVFKFILAQTEQKP